MKAYLVGFFINEESENFHEFKVIKLGTFETKEEAEVYIKEFLFKNGLIFNFKKKIDGKHPFYYFHEFEERYEKCFDFVKENCNLGEEKVDISEERILNEEKFINEFMFDVKNLRIDSDKLIRLYGYTFDDGVWSLFID